MKILFSVPTGYHLRELVMPLKPHLENDSGIDRIQVVTPAAPHHKKIFPTYSDTFSFHENPEGVEAHKKLFRTLQPDVVVTNTVGHDELDYPILKAAQLLDIPSVTFIASWDNVWKIGRLMKDDVPIALADHIIVWNQMMKDHLQELFPELPDERIEVIGAPRLDYFWHEDTIPSKQEIYAKLGFEDTSRPLIHFATTELYPMDYVVEAVRAGIDAGTITHNPYLYVSVHPGGDMSKHENLSQSNAVVRYSPGRSEHPPHPNFAYNASEEDIYTLVGIFRHADLLINQSSTTALESIIARTPVINVKYGKPWDWWKWYRSMVYRDFKQHYKDLLEDNVTTIVHSRKQLIAEAQNLLSNPDVDMSATEKTLQRMITTTDGTASENVLRSIKTHAAG